jgi:hypothetical protein
VPEGEAALTDVRAEVWPLLERLDGERTLQDAVALTRLDEFTAAKTACAMLFLGIVKRKGGPGAGELDLAEQALSGFGEKPPEGATPSAEVPRFKPEEEPPAPEVPLFKPEEEEAPPAEVPLFKPEEEEAPPAEVPLFKPEEEPESPPEGAPAPVIVPSDAAPSFAALDAEAEGGVSLAFPEAEPEVAAPESEPLGAQPEPDVPSAFPVPEPDSEPVGVKPEPVSTAAGVEPTGFDFVQSESPEIPGAEPPAEAPSGPADEPTMALPTTEPPAVSPEPPAAGPVPSFTVDAPPRKETDTVPGDRPVYTPPAPEAPAEAGAEISAFGASAPAPEPEAPSIPAPPTPEASGRPSQEDLAALDELLHPSGSDVAKKPVERTRTERWEPQFRTADSTAPVGPSGSSRRAVGRRSRGSKAPILAAVVGLVIAGAAAGYFLLGRSSTPAPSPQPTTAPTTAPTPALSAPATVAPAPSATPSPTLPSPAATAVPAAAVPAATPAPTPPPTPVPAPVPTPAATTPTAAGPAASTGEARALLRQGALAPAAQGFAASLASSRTSYSIQTLVACSPENVQKAVQNVAGDELFVLPVNLDGRSCYRVCWGLFESQAAAEAALPSLPPYFPKGMVQPLASLLP